MNTTGPVTTAHERVEPAITSRTEPRGTRMSSPSSPARLRLIRPVVAFLVAGGINVLIILILANFNGLGSPIAEAPSNKAVVILQDTVDIRSHRPPQVTEPETAQEIMTVDLDLPIPEPADVMPMDLNLWIPEARTGSNSAAHNPAEDLGSADSVSIYSSSQVDEPPRELVNEPPRYPRAALKKEIEGSVILKLLINASGRIDDMQVVSVEGDPSFRDAVLHVARDWRFTPAKHHGKPVPVWGIKRIRFELEK